MTLNHHLESPRWRNTWRELFEPQVKTIGIMNQRDCPTGLLAFGYPETRYGYDTYTQITIEDIPLLESECLRRGFTFSHAHQDGVISICFAIPGTRHWSEFVERVSYES